jgi:hypothetical protein
MGVETKSPLAGLSPQTTAMVAWDQPKAWLRVSTYLTAAVHAHGFRSQCSGPQGIILLTGRPSHHIKADQYFICRADADRRRSRLEFLMIFRYARQMELD